MNVDCTVAGEGEGVGAERGRERERVCVCMCMFPKSLYGDNPIYLAQKI